MRSSSPLEHVLKGLIPFTEENMLLAYKPNLFFNELEKIDKKQHKKQTFSRSALKMAYYRARQNGLWEMNANGFPCLTAKGEQKLQRYRPRKIEGASLLVIFDIQEAYRSKRDELRRLLVALKFKQVQRSVWISEYDSRQVLALEISRMNLTEEVIIYESKKLKL